MFHKDGLVGHGVPVGRDGSRGRVQQLFLDYHLRVWTAKFIPPNLWRWNQSLALPMIFKVGKLLSLAICYNTMYIYITDTRTPLPKRHLHDIWFPSMKPVALNRLDRLSPCAVDPPRLVIWFNFEGRSTLSHRKWRVKRGHYRQSASQSPWRLLGFSQSRVTMSSRSIFPSSICSSGDGVCISGVCW